MRLQKMGSKLKCGDDFEIVNPEDDPRYQKCWQEYHNIAAREGVTPDNAKAALRKFNTLIGAILVRLGDADGMICGMIDTYHDHLKFIEQVLGKAEGVENFAAMNLLMLPGRNLFISDTYVNEVPTPTQLADMTILAAREIEKFGIAPKVALLSNSNFGSVPTASSQAHGGGAQADRRTLRRSWKWKAKCMATRRCRKSCARPRSRRRR